MTKGDGQMLLVIRKPTTVKGWTISIGVATVVAGAVFGWCQHTTNSLGELATDLAVIRSQTAKFDRRLERVEDALIGRAHVAHFGGKIP